jgi:ubiquinone/menaquinone biosynthesis C-methylase UbiE
MYTEREFYERKYHYDEDLTVQDKKRISRFFRDIQFKKSYDLLDVGCGAGAALSFCHKRGLRCFGFDISQRAISLNRFKTETEVTTLIADGERLPFGPQRFDIVSSLGSIEHFSSLERGLEEINRVTRRGGQVLLVVPNSYWLLNKLHLYKGTEQPQEVLATMGEWARLFNKHRLAVQKIGKDVGPRVLKNKKPISLLKRLLLKTTIALPLSFAYQFIFVCRKN